MKQDRILHVLYDLALVTGSQTRVSPLIKQFMQRLLFHTPFSCAVFVSRVTGENHSGEVEVELMEAIGGNIQGRKQTLLNLDAGELDKPSGNFSPDEEYKALFAGGSRYLNGLRLSLNEKDQILLYSEINEEFSVDLARVLAPVIENFNKTLTLCRENEAYTNALESELAHRKKLEAMLLKKERQALVGQLATSVNHELRNPLASIMTASFVIQKKLEQGSSDIAANLDIVNANTRRCNAIIDQLLEYTSSPSLRKRSCSVIGLIRNVLEKYEFESDIIVEENFDQHDKSIVEVDQGEISTAIVNILDNARDAVIRNGAGLERRITIDVLHRNNSVGISIRDNGSGIDKKILDKVLDPLTSTKSFGLGLGLPIANNIALLHGGSLEINSIPGNGAELVIWL